MSLTKPRGWICKAIFFLVDGLYQLNYMTVYDQNGDHIDIEADKELINQVKDSSLLANC